MRRRLVRYFQRKRCLAPDELADETLNRVARRLEEAGQIVDVPPARYCYIVAKFVLLEHVRQTDQHRAVDVTVADRPRDAAAGHSDIERREQMLECLDRCLGGLERDDADLILRYYRGEQRVKIEQRRRLAAERDLTANALSIRACRIRDKLEACINACRANRDRVTFRRFSSQGDE
jgi:hypothetical protein